MTVFLVRHAHAGKRSHWDADDTQRPLSERGFTQTTAITDLLIGRDVGRVVSSPFLRCRQTVEPLAVKAGVGVGLDARFAEGADPDPALEALLALDRSNGVACTHGDLIPPLLDRLVAMGMEADGPLLHRKGSVWTIDTEHGRPTRGFYTPPQT